jgi:hypothetical protein
MHLPHVALQGPKGNRVRESMSEDPAYMVHGYKTWQIGSGFLKENKQVWAILKKKTN